MKKGLLKLSVLLNIALVCGALIFTAIYWEKIYEKFRSKKKPEIVMLGDSLTFYGKWHQLLDRNDVINCGADGYTTSKFVMLLEIGALKHNPKICYVLGGINDIAVGVPLERSLSNINNLIDTLQHHNITPIIQSVLYTSNPETNKQVDTLNENIKQMTSEKNVEYLDLNKRLSKNKLLIKRYTVDGLHLTADAYLIWAKMIKENLSKHSPSPTISSSIATIINKL